jgi:hypothetical protein
MKNDELQMIASETGRIGLAFDRQPRESLKAFPAIRAYLDLGAQRSLATVANKLGKSKVLMERWSRRYDWSGRVLAYHEYLTTLERQAIEARAVSKSVEWEKMTEAVRREAWKKSDDLLAMADEFIERWRESSRVPGFESVVRGVELAIRLKQLATALPTDTLRVQGQVKATIEVDWEMALRRVYGPKEAPAAVVDVETMPTTEPAKEGA